MHAGWYNTVTVIAVFSLPLSIKNPSALSFVEFLPRSRLAVSVVPLLYTRYFEAYILTDCWHFLTTIVYDRLSKPRLKDRWMHWAYIMISPRGQPTAVHCSLIVVCVQLDSTSKYTNFKYILLPITFQPYSAQASTKIHSFQENVLHVNFKSFLSPPYLTLIQLPST